VSKVGVGAYHGPCTDGRILLDNHVWADVNTISEADAGSNNCCGMDGFRLLPRRMEEVEQCGKRKFRVFNPDQCLPIDGHVNVESDEYSGSLAVNQMPDVPGSDHIGQFAGSGGQDRSHATNQLGRISFDLSRNAIGQFLDAECHPGLRLRSGPPESSWGANCVKS
jgi:hypothetical protein